MAASNCACMFLESEQERTPLRLKALHMELTARKDDTEESDKEKARKQPMMARRHRKFKEVKQTMYELKELYKRDAK